MFLFQEWHVGVVVSLDQKRFSVGSGRQLGFNEQQVRILVQNSEFKQEQVY